MRPLPCLALVVPVALFLPASALAQAYEGKPCKTAGNASLKGLKVGAALPDLDQALTGSFTNWSTSMLGPDGKPPRPEKREPGWVDELNEEAQRKDEWTCAYSAQRAFDGDPRTAWCEGAKDDGVGEVLVAPVEPGKPVKIWAGVGRSPALFAANHRPRKVRVTLIEAEVSAVHQSGTGFAHLKAVAQREVELADKNGWQKLPLPEAGRSAGEPKPAFVAIEILSVYPGKVRDTCVTEVASE